MADNDDTGDEHESQGPRSLVPMYAGQDVDQGIQAFRRGEMILYTVRGEPHEVQELVDELNKKGVNEVVALISHQSFEKQDEAGDEPPKDVDAEDEDES